MDEDKTIHVPLDAVMESYITGATRLIPLINWFESKNKRRTNYPSKRAYVEKYDASNIHGKGGGASDVCSVVRRISDRMKEYVPVADSLLDIGRSGSPVIVLSLSDISHYVIALHLLAARWIAHRLGRKDLRVLIILWDEGVPGETERREGVRGLARVILDGVDYDIVPTSSLDKEEIINTMFNVSELVAGVSNLFIHCGINRNENYIINLIFDEQGTMEAAILRAYYLLSSMIIHNSGEHTSDGRTYIYIGSLSYYIVFRKFIESLIFAVNHEDLMPGGALRAYNKLKDKIGIKDRSVYLVQFRKLSYINNLVDKPEAVRGLNLYHIKVDTTNAHRGTLDPEPLRDMKTLLERNKDSIIYKIKNIKNKKKEYRLCDSYMLGLSHPLDLLVTYRALRAIEEGSKEIALPRIGVTSKLNFSANQCWDTLDKIISSSFIDNTIYHLGVEYEAWNA